MKTVALDASDSDDVVSGGSRPLALVEGGPPPTEYVMFEPGINPTVKGDLLFDDEAAAAVMAHFKERGRDRIAGDWEHDSMVPPEQRPANYKGSPASHWFTPEVRPGPQLVAANVKWTPVAFEQLTRGEYAHTSPVVKFQKATGRIMAVLSSALTNDPATIGQPQMIAASAESTKIEPPAKAPEIKKMPMFKMADDDAKNVKAIVDGEHADEKEMCGKLKACLSEAFPDHFGEKEEKKEPLAEEAGKDPKAMLAETEAKKADEEEKKELRALSAAVIAITGKSKRVEQVAALTAMKDQSEEVATLTATIRAANGSAFDNVIALGRKAMKLTPADCAPGSTTKAGKYIALQRGKGDEGVMALSAYLDASAARVTTAETAATEQRSQEIDTVTLTAAEVESCEKNGTDKKAYLANKRSRIADGDAPVFSINR